MNRMNARLLGAIVGGVTLMGIAAAPAFAQDSAAPKTKHESKHEEKQADKAEKKQEKQAEKTAAKAKVGEAAPAFTLTDTDGKTVNLSDYKGKIVVLEWFNPDCPVVQMHYKAGTMAKTQAAFAGKDVTWLSINSGGAGKEGAGKQRNADAKKDWKMTNPVLIDEAGTVGHLYGATNTPHMFVIDKTGTLAYAGAIDDGNPGKAGKTNYVENAVNALLKGESVSPATTKAYGCGVKYGKQGA
jgi:peroxiredoxin